MSTEVFSLTNVLLSVGLPSLGYFAQRKADKLFQRLDDQDEKFAQYTVEIAKRTTRLEFILTGDQGKNGVRKEVQELKEQIAELKDALFNQNEANHTRIGALALWQQQVDQVLTTLKPRRKNGGRRKTDK